MGMLPLKAESHYLILRGEDFGEPLFGTRQNTPVNDFGFQVSKGEVNFCSRLPSSACSDRLAKRILFSRDWRDLRRNFNFCSRI